MCACIVSGTRGRLSCAHDAASKLKSCIAAICGLSLAAATLLCCLQSLKKIRN